MRRPIFATLALAALLAGCSVASSSSPTGSASPPTSQDTRRPSSPTETARPISSAQAERLNGILKQEYGLGATFARKALVPAAVKEAVTQVAEVNSWFAVGINPQINQLLLATKPAGAK